MRKEPSTDCTDYTDKNGKGSADPKTYAVIGAAMEVHRQLGHGFSESVYQEAFAIELSEREIPFLKERPLSIHYKGHELASRFRADFICFDEIIVETKALNALSGNEHSQVLNYLKTAGLSLGLLLNFGQRSLQYKRIAW